MMIEHDELREDFPELFEENVNLSKEILAHFGLVFSSFALLEAALQNLVVVCGLTDRLLQSPVTAEAWMKDAEALERKALKSTFGTLLRLLENQDRFRAVRPALMELKRQRDYFAHSFFREENKNMFSSERQMFLIAAMAKLRRDISSAEKAVDGICAELMKSWNPAKDWESDIRQLASKLETDRLSEPRLQVGWASSE